MEIKDNTYTHFTKSQERDFALVNRIKKGDDKAFEELMQIYFKPVLYTIKRIVGNEQDAEDLTLEVFSKIYFNLDMFSPLSSFSTWLFRVASNHAIDFLRKRRLESVPLIVDNEDENGKSWIKNLSDDILSPEEKIIKLQNVQEIRKLMKKLPDGIKEILEMKYFDDLSYKEIAKKLNVPIGTVKARLHRAKKFLLMLAKDYYKRKK